VGFLCSELGSEGFINILLIPSKGGVAVLAGFVDVLGDSAAFLKAVNKLPLKPPLYLPNVNR
jgi:hypothetical protein